MKATTKFFALLTATLICGLSLVSCQDSNDVSKNDCSDVTLRKNIVSEYEEDEFCHLMGQWHNDGVQYIIDRMEADGITFFQYYGQDKYNLVEGYLAEFGNEMSQKYLECDLADLPRVSFSSTEDYHAYLMANFSSQFLTIYAEFESIISPDSEYEISMLSKLYDKCNSISDENERVIMKSSIAVAQASYDYWTNFDYARAHEVFTPQELYPYLPADYEPFTYQISDRTKRIANVDAQKFVKTFGQGTMALLYSGGEILPTTWLGLGLVSAILSAYESYNMYEREMELERLKQTPTNSYELFLQQGIIFDYLKSMYLESPDFYMNYYDGKFNFLIQYF